MLVCRVLVLVFYLYWPLEVRRRKHVMMMRISFYNFETILQGKVKPSGLPCLLLPSVCGCKTQCWDFQAAVKLAGPDVSLERGVFACSGPEWLSQDRKGKVPGVVVSRQVDRKGKVPETVLEQTRDLRGIPWIRQGSAVVLGKRSRRKSHPRRSVCASQHQQGGTVSPPPI